MSVNITVSGAVFTVGLAPDARGDTPDTDGGVLAYASGNASPLPVTTVFDGKTAV
jgi:hypothetical protein